MNLQDVKSLSITEGDVRTIHNSDGSQLWGKVSYDTKYGGDTTQQTYSGKNLFDFNGWASVSPIPANDINNATANQIFDNGIIVTGDTSTATAAEAASKGWFRPAYSSSSLQYRVRIGAISDITVSADVTLLSLG